MTVQAETLNELAGAVAATLRQLSNRQFSQRLWLKDPSLWKQEPEHQRIIRNALGWLTVVAPMQQQTGDLVHFGSAVRTQGFTHALLLGMGGSSLCVEVMRRSFGSVSGYPEMLVLDSTDPGTIRGFENAIDPEKTLFIVASKSGTTVEVSSFHKYFFEKTRLRRGTEAGLQFIAVTDPGTPLEKIGQEQQFLRVFINPADIGGRFSALSLFGMVPAALMGLDVAGLLRRAENMAVACGASVPLASNPGVRLGVVMAEAAKAGLDKLTLIAPPSLAAFGLWVEQLVAESTGKEGKGIVPIDGEPLGEANSYGGDRLFVKISIASEEDPRQEELVRTLEASGRAVVRLTLQDHYDLGAEFFRWEIATAVAGALLEINPFDQPNVQESKDNTNRLLNEFRQTGNLPQEPPAAFDRELSLFCSPEYRSRLEAIVPAPPASRSVAGYLAAHLQGLRAGDYLALNAYLEASAAHHSRLQSLRNLLRDRFRVATTLGYGPRFLHSTGQLHKGGADNGVFIQVTADDATDLPIPGEPYSFSILKQAQALGDFQSLASRQRRAIRLHLGKDISGGLDLLIRLAGA